MRDRIHEDVCRKAFDPELGSFVQAYGSKALDASLLLLPLVGFLPPEDPRIIGTVEAIERRLLVDGFVLRYDTGEVADGLPPGEGAFLACTFWLADNFILQGRIAEARELFERLLALRNDVGLLAEEYDPRKRTPARELPAGILACRPGQHRVQPDPEPRASGTTRRAPPQRPRAGMMGGSMQAVEPHRAAGHHLVPGFR